ncbi:MAG: L-Lys-D/L-Arg epimerase [Flavobacterium sp. SCGC AAA160-P02]|nr:MAG: L-Lys-D/L-Arg epimerase [Flavobacterium sp. SCGC AAA160-P02]
MNIKNIEFFSKNLVLTKPYTIAYKTITEVENVFLLITLENGIIGIGAANPDFQVVGESPADVLKTYQSDYFQKFIGKSIKYFRSMIYDVSIAFPNKPGTLVLWDIALHDAFAKYLNIPVTAIYGQHIHALPTSVTIGIMDVQDTLRQASEYVQQGFKVLKIKTGQEVELDIERIIKVNEKFHNIKIRVDANQGYEVKDLEQFIKATNKLGLEIIEQPLLVGKETELSEIDKQYRSILVADESLKNSKSAISFTPSPQPYGIFNIKLMKCGGILSALEIATIAKVGGIDLFWGCNDESIVSITAALHAAYACVNTKYLDLDGSLDLAEDIVNGGFILKDGMMSISDKPGLGVELNNI